jgi:hypothetical protein
MLRGNAFSKSRPFDESMFRTSCMRYSLMIMMTMMAVVVMVMVMVIIIIIIIILTYSVALQP